MPDALQQFQRTLIYDNTATSDVLLKDLAEIGTLDKERESSAKKFGCLGFLLVVAAIGGAVVGLAIHPAVGIAWLVAAGGGGVYMLVRAYLANKGDVEDRRYKLAKSVVDLLSRDVAVDTPISLRVSMLPAIRKQNFITKGNTGHWKFKMYHDVWLELQVKLVDGTACRIQLTERHQKRHRWKTSASGKSKLKTKVKSGLEVHVRLKPKTHKYMTLSELGQDAKGAVQLPVWSTLKGVTVEDGGLALKAATKTEWDATDANEKGRGPHGVHLVAMAMLSLYQILNLSKAVTKANPQGDTQ